MSLVDTVRLEYRDKFCSLYNDAFQAWFEDLTRLLHPVGDFQSVRKTSGDGGLDGFVINSQLVYQVYAPGRRSEDRDSETAEKIKADFHKAYSHLQGRLKTWVFVHNHPEAKLGKLSINATSDLKEQYQDVEIKVFNIDVFWQELQEKVAIERIAQILHVAIPQSDHVDPARIVIARFAYITRRDAEEKRICGIPEPLERSEVGYVEDALQCGKPVLVTGEAGVGKSGVACALCTPRTNMTLSVLYLDVRRYSHVRSPKELAETLELPVPFIESTRLVGKTANCRLIIDQLDNAATEASGRMFIELAIELSQQTNIQIVIVSRRQEGYERDMLEPLVDAGFEDIPCNELSTSVTENTLHMLGIASPTDDLVKLCRNLLNLDIVARLRQKAPSFDFSAISEEFDLWEEFIKALDKVERVSAHGVVFGALVIKEATKLARSGLLAEEKTFMIQPPLTSEQRRLESWGIIAQYEGFAYRFRHEKFRDFLYVRDAVSNATMPAGVLQDIHSHHVHSILIWMHTVYPRICPSKYGEFLRSFLNG
jgi:hypothetical protein